MVDLLVRETLLPRVHMSSAQKYGYALDAFAILYRDTMHNFLTSYNAMLCIIIAKSRHFIIYTNYIIK